MDSLNYDIIDGIVVLRLSGDYSIEAVLSSLKAALDDPQTPERVRLLVDARESQADRPTDDVRRMAEGFAGHASRLVRVAVVVDSQVHFGLARLGSAHVDPTLSVAVFRDYTDALEELEV